MTADNESSRVQLERSDCPGMNHGQPSNGRGCAHSPLKGTYRETAEEGQSLNFMHGGPTVPSLWLARPPSSGHSFACEPHYHLWAATPLSP
eukprot:1152370-Pelagomonas_calceolata.AAC.1